MPLLPEEITALQYALANGSYFVPAQLTAGGTVFKLQIQDILNLVGLPVDVMTKSVYNVSGNGVVDDSQKLGGQLPSYYLDLSNLNTNFSNAQILALISLLNLSGYQLLSEKGQPLGYCPIGANGLIPPQFYISTGLVPKGNWNVVTNTPAISDATGTTGWWYIVTNSANPTARNLGSGIKNFNDGDWVIHDGAAYQINGNGVPSSITINGVTNTTFTLTTNNIPDFAGKRYIVEAVKDALAATQAGLFPASTANPIATEDFVTNALNSVAVGITWLTPENFSDGNSVGNGTAQFLNALGYTNGTASAYWTLVPGINVATFTLDDVAKQQAYFTAEQTNGGASVWHNANRCYYHNQTIQLPRFPVNPTVNNRSSKFYIEGNGSVSVLMRGIPLLSRMPANQTAADGNGNDSYDRYALIIRNMSLQGSSSAANQEWFGILLGASYNAKIENVSFRSMTVGLAAYFTLNLKVSNCNFGDCSFIGSYISTGVGSGKTWSFGDGWAGASLANSPSHGTSFIDGNQFRVGQGSFAGLASYGNDGITVGGASAYTVFEGADGGVQPLHHAFISNSGSTTVKGCSIGNLHIEQQVQTSHICVEATASQFAGNIYEVYPYLGNPAPAMFEARGAGVVIMNLERNTWGDTGWLLRNTGAGTHYWNKYLTRVRNQANFSDPANWDTSGGATIPNAAQLSSSGGNLP